MKHDDLVHDLKHGKYGKRGLTPVVPATRLDAKDRIVRPTAAPWCMSSLMHDTTLPPRF